MELLPMQMELTPWMPTVVGNVDYQEFRETLERMDEILVKGGIEEKFLQMHIAESCLEAEKEAARKGKVFDGLSVKVQLCVQQHGMYALRCNIARELIGESVREFTTHLADSPLLQSFCRIARMDKIRVPCKSTIDRYGRLVPEDIVRTVVNELNRVASSEPEGEQHILGLQKSLSLETYFLDSTCVKANIRTLDLWEVEVTPFHG